MVRLSAAAALWRITDETRAPLAVLIDSLDHGQSLFVRQQAALHLKAMGAAARPALAALRRASSDPNPAVRQHAVAALRAIDPAGTVGTP
jgi:HEAT repeat protein